MNCTPFQVDEIGGEDRADSIESEEAALNSQLTQAESRLNDLSRMQQDSDVRRSIALILIVLSSPDVNAIVLFAVPSRGHGPGVPRSQARVIHAGGPRQNDRKQLIFCQTVVMIFGVLAMNLRMG
jgi:hypothetical protein